MWSEKAAKNSIFNHLSHSTYHSNLTKAEINKLVDDSEIVTHSYVDCDDEHMLMDDEHIRGSKPIRGRGRGKVRCRSPSQEPSSGSRHRGPDRVPPRGASSSDQQLVVRQLQTGIQTQTRHAISFVRALTRAEKALRLAETVARRAMETFQDMGMLLKGCACCGI